MQILHLFLFGSLAYASVICVTQTEQELMEFKKYFFAFLNSIKNDSNSFFSVLENFHQDMNKCSCASDQLKKIYSYLNKFEVQNTMEVKVMQTTLKILINKLDQKKVKCSYKTIPIKLAKRSFERFFNTFHMNICTNVVSQERRKRNESSQ